MVQVYKGYLEGVQEVAIKVFAETSTDHHVIARKKLLKEVALLKSCRSPSIVQVGSNPKICRVYLRSIDWDVLMLADLEQRLGLSQLIPAPRKIFSNALVLLLCGAASLPCNTAQQLITNVWVCTPQFLGVSFVEQDVWLVMEYLEGGERLKVLHSCSSDGLVAPVGGRSPVATMHGVYSKQTRSPVMMESNVFIRCGTCCEAT